MVRSQAMSDVLPATYLMLVFVTALIVNIENTDREETVPIVVTTRLFSKGSHQAMIVIVKNAKMNKKG